jgi:hypothetical protein
MLWNEHIVVSGHDASQNDHDHKKMRKGEPGNHHGFVTKSVKLGIGEAEDNSKHGAIYITEEERQEGRDIPVMAAAYNDIEIAAELVSLSNLFSDVDRKKRRRGLTE